MNTTIGYNQNTQLHLVWQSFAKISSGTSDGKRKIN